MEELKTSEAQRRAVKKYDKANTSSTSIKFNHTSDADILEWLEKQNNKQGAIKDAIRKSFLI